MSGIASSDREEETSHIGARRADDPALFVHPLPDRQYRTRGPGYIAVTHTSELGIGFPVHGAEDPLHERFSEAVEIPHRRRCFVGGDAHHGPDPTLHRYPYHVLASDHVYIHALQGLVLCQVHELGGRRVDHHVRSALVENVPDRLDVDHIEREDFTASTLSRFQVQFVVPSGQDNSGFGLECPPQVPSQEPRSPRHEHGLFRHHASVFGCSLCYI